MIDPNFPLIDLHRHLEGNVRLETILDLGLRHDLPLPSSDLEGLRPYIQVTEPQVSVMAFISKFEWYTRVMVDYHACRRIAFENVEDASLEGIDYIELRFSPWFMSEPHQLEPSGVVAAVIEGAEEGSNKFGLRVKLIGIISRTYGVEIAKKELRALLDHHEKLVGLDLAGDEANYPADLFHDHFQKAKDVGWHITVHAGENTGPESVWAAIRKLGASRIGHAVTAVEDSKLLDYLAQNQVGVESSITSNVQTSSVPNYESHPIRLFLERGILASINTDDPAISNIDLKHEYEVAAPAAGLTPKQIQQAQHNALSIAFLPSEEKEFLLAKKQSF
ncbi:MAG: adenosine deaminase [Anaerolineales bacterium]